MLYMKLYDQDSSIHSVIKHSLAYKDLARFYNLPIILNSSVSGQSLSRGTSSILKSALQLDKESSCLPTHQSASKIELFKEDIQNQAADDKVIKENHCDFDTGKYKDINRDIMRGSGSSKNKATEKVTNKKMTTINNNSIVININKHYPNLTSSALNYQEEDINHKSKVIPTAPSQKSRNQLGISRTDRLNNSQQNNQQSPKPTSINQSIPLKQVNKNNKLSSHIKTLITGGDLSNNMTLSHDNLQIIKSNSVFSKRTAENDVDSVISEKSNRSNLTVSLSIALSQSKSTNEGNTRFKKRNNKFAEEKHQNFLRYQQMILGESGPQKVGHAQNQSRLGMNRYANSNILNQSIQNSQQSLNKQEQDLTISRSRSKLRENQDYNFNQVEIDKIRNFFTIDNNQFDKIPKTSKSGVKLPRILSSLDEQNMSQSIEEEQDHMRNKSGARTGKAINNQLNRFNEIQYQQKLKNYIPSNRNQFLTQQKVQQL
eukprot:403350872